MQELDNDGIQTLKEEAKPANSNIECAQSEKVPPEEPKVKQSAPQTTEQPQLGRNVDHILAGDDETDYTYSPAKMVEAYDGNKLCASICLSYDLSGKMQEALMGRRALQDLQLEIEQEREDLATREQEVFIFILERDEELENIEIAIEDAQGEIPVEQQQQQQQMEQLRDFIAQGKDEQAAIKEEEDSLNAQWESARQRMEFLQSQIDLVLDNVFVKSKLLPLPTPKELDVSLEQPAGDLNADIPSTLPVGDDLSNHHTDEVDDTAQVDETRQACYNLDQCREELEEAQRDFNLYQNGYEQSLQSYLSQQIDRPFAESKTDHDLLYLQRGRDRTRRLLEVEASLESAKATAKAAGVPAHYHQGSQFGDCPDDGSRESQEADIMATVDRKRIEAWLMSGDAKQGNVPLSEPVIDEWEIHEEKTFDSVSVLAEGPNRKKID